MKLMVGYGIWCKRDMMSWLLEGVARSFSRDDTCAAFFDACDDGSEDAFDHMTDYFLPGWQIMKGRSATGVYESGCHNALIDMFLASDCDALLVAQDDQRFNGYEGGGIGSAADEQVAEFLAEHGDSLGVVGGRDGFGPRMDSMVSAEHSRSVTTGKTLGYGDYAPVVMVNSGPVLYSRNLISRIGRPDPSMRFYRWEDYSARAHEAGLRNFVADFDVTHAKFGIQKASTIYQPEISARDLALFRERHPGML